MNTHGVAKHVTRILNCTNVQLVIESFSNMTKLRAAIDCKFAVDIITYKKMDWPIKW
jgi:hypothetical protein